MQLNPQEVVFAGTVWAGVRSVRIDRTSPRLIEAWSDTGPHASLVDTPEQRVVVRVEQSVAVADPAAPALGSEGELVVEFGSSAGDLGRVRARIAAVVVQVTQTIGTSESGRVIMLRGVSPDGATDPVVFEDV